MKASSSIKTTIKSIEKCRLKPYLVRENDDYLVYFGHNLRTKDYNEAVKRSKEKSAEEFLEEDIKNAEGIITRISNVRKLTQNQFDALISVSYSMGYFPGNFKEMLQDDKNTQDEWAKKIGDGILSLVPSDKETKDGILDRRIKENDVFLNGKYYSSSFDCK